MPEELLVDLAAMPELSATSEAEQMYLITVAQAIEEGVDGPVSISRIAAQLSVSVPSANEMVKKLAGRQLLTYEPYHGVELTADGAFLANQVLRTRRLWATFLAEHLGFSPVEADAQACHLEHATSPEAANRLATFLGNPEAGPLGHPIPDGTRTPRRQPAVRLSEAPVGVTVEVISVAAAGSASEFLRSEGIKAGVHLSVAASGSTGLLVNLEGDAVHLNNALAGTVEVRPHGAFNAPA